MIILLWSSVEQQHARKRFYWYDVSKMHRSGAFMNSYWTSENFTVLIITTVFASTKATKTLMMSKRGWWSRNDDENKPNIQPIYVYDVGNQPAVTEP